MSFGAIADDYDRLRPGPPDEAVDWLVPERCRVAVDLAAGTGLLTRALARKVGRVVAVEPDERMAAVLAARSPRERFPGVRVVRGTGEAIPLADASADGVFISSAWHWLDPERAIPEIARVLGDGGRFGVIWTSRDREAGWFSEAGWFRRDDWFRGSGSSDEPGQRDAEAQRDAEGHSDARAQGEAEALRDADAEDQRETVSYGDGRPRSRRREIALPEGLFGPAEGASFAFTRAMTVGDILGMLSTYSGVITAPPQDREAGLARVRAALEQRFPGAAEIDVPMRSWCFRAHRIPRAVHESTH
jgi:SAM-dependent methyltransferase